MTKWQDVTVGSVWELNDGSIHTIMAIEDFTTDDGVGYSELVLNDGSRLLGSYNLVRRIEGS